MVTFIDSLIIGCVVGVVIFTFTFIVYMFMWDSLLGWLFIKTKKKEVLQKVKEILQKYPNNLVKQESDLLEARQNELIKSRYSTKVIQYALKNMKKIDLQEEKQKKKEEKKKYKQQTKLFKKNGNKDANQQLGEAAQQVEQTKKQEVDTNERFEEKKADETQPAKGYGRESEPTDGGIRRRFGGGFDGGGIEFARRFGNKRGFGSRLGTEQDPRLKIPPIQKAESRSQSEPRRLIASSIGVSNVGSVQKSTGNSASFSRYSGGVKIVEKGEQRVKTTTEHSARGSGIGTGGFNRDHKRERRFSRR